MVRLRKAKAVLQFHRNPVSASTYFGSRRSDYTPVPKDYRHRSKSSTMRLGKWPGQKRGEGACAAKEFGNGARHFSGLELYPAKNSRCLGSFVAVRPFHIPRRTISRCGSRFPRPDRNTYPTIDYLGRQCQPSRTRLWLHSGWGRFGPDTWSPIDCGGALLGKTKC